MIEVFFGDVECRTNGELLWSVKHPDRALREMSFGVYLLLERAEDSLTFNCSKGICLLDTAVKWVSGGYVPHQNPPNPGAFL